MHEKLFEFISFFDIHAMILLTLDVLPKFVLPAQGHIGSHGRFFCLLRSQDHEER